MTFRSGDKVLTPLGEGEIIYQRMKPPLYNEPEAFSVKLYSKKNELNYSGTVFAAEDVQKA